MSPMGRRQDLIRALDDLDACVGRLHRLRQYDDAVVLLVQLVEEHILKLHRLAARPERSL